MSRYSDMARAVLAAAASLLVGAGCNVERRTQVMLEIDAECEVRAASDRVEITVTSFDASGAMAGSSTMPHEVSPDGRGWPWRVALVPLDGDATRRFEVRIRATGELETATFVRAGYERERTLGLRVVLLDDCLANPMGCEATEACVAGGCTAPVREGLPDWAPGEPACFSATTDAGPRDASWDGGTDVGSDGGNSGVPEIDFCRELVAASCEGRIRCCDAAAGETLDECRTRNEAACRSLLEPITSERDLEYDPAEARRAIDEVIAVGQSCGLGLPDLLLTPEGIYRAWDGTLARGDVCSRTLNPVINHALCVGDRSCRSVGAVRRTCADRSTEGGTCRDSLDCETGLYCVGGSAVVDGVCRPRLADGAMCSSYFECQSFICEGMVCVARTEENVYCADPFGTM